MSDANLNYKIRFDVELKALRDLEKELMAQMAKAKALGKPYAELGDQLLRVQSRLGEFGAFKKFRGELEGLAAQIPGISGLVNVLNGSFLKVASAEELIRRSLRAWEEEEKHIISLDQAMGNRAALTAEFRDKLHGVAEELERLSGVDAGQWMQTSAQLLKFGAPTDKVAEYTEAVGKLANLLGGDVSEASRLFIRAMNGHTEALSRVGIQLDQNLSPSERFAQLLNILSSSATNSTVHLDTYTGSLKHLWTEIGQLFKTIGSWLAPIATILNKILAVPLEAFNNLFHAFKPVSEDINNQAKSFISSAETAQAGINDLNAAAGNAANPPAVAPAKPLRKAISYHFNPPAVAPAKPLRKAISYH